MGSSYFCSFWGKNKCSPYFTQLGNLFDSCKRLYVFYCHFYRSHTLKKLVYVHSLEQYYSNDNTKFLWFHFPCNWYSVRWQHSADKTSFWGKKKLSVDKTIEHFWKFWKLLYLGDLYKMCANVLQFLVCISQFWLSFL